MLPRVAERYELHRIERLAQTTNSRSETGSAANHANSRRRTVNVITAMRPSVATMAIIPGQPMTRCRVSAKKPVPTIMRVTACTNLGDSSNERPNATASCTRVTGPPAPGGDRSLS